MLRAHFFFPFWVKGAAPDYIALPPIGGVGGARRKWDIFLVVSPRGQVIILIYLPPVLQLLCHTGSDHLCGFIISAGTH